MADRGRVVVVAAGFALWMGGRCVAAARWSDIRRLRGFPHGMERGDVLSLEVELVDGSRVELREDAPGFDAFVDRAAVTLSGMLPFRDWHHAIAAQAAAEGALFYDRTTRRY